MGLDFYLAQALALLVGGVAGSVVARRQLARAPAAAAVNVPAWAIGGATVAAIVFNVLLGVTALLYFFSGPPPIFVLLGLTTLVVLAVAAAIDERRRG